MNIFGLIIIELVKIVDTRAGMGKQDPSRSGLIWTSVLQGGLLLLGLILLMGGVQDSQASSRSKCQILNTISHERRFKTIKC